eukprot:TRINITY_DN15619_c0_g1_i1.p1 TRINITY_DN15619_c0_g1~~TRINITY_DN15619_c0_g1_i1.p1  ORF type:complete len:1136 (+),score=256.04 TRINITY_DN15619_c0_g1_i1:104-3511(+)
MTSSFLSAVQLADQEAYEAELLPYLDRVQQECVNSFRQSSGDAASLVSLDSADALGGEAATSAHVCTPTTAAPGDEAGGGGGDGGTRHVCGRDGLALNSSVAIGIGTVAGFCANATRAIAGRVIDAASLDRTAAAQISCAIESGEVVASSSSSGPLQHRRRQLLSQPPRMSVAILVVGTRGDVQPFMQLGQRLKRDGHRVRLATHEVYRGLIRGVGLEFYPLGGDPKKLAQYMCKGGGRLMPNVLKREELDAIPEHMAMLKEMMFAARGAVSEPDPADDSRETAHLPSFCADAIIANPCAYGHVHVAEWLEVPVHLMLPVPWTPTGDFPHPLSIFGGGCAQRELYPEGYGAVFRRAQNYASYYAIDEFLYAGLRFMMNEFRESLGLEPIRSGEAGAQLIHNHRVPFAYQWSPSVLPRPADYGPHVEVTGTIFNHDGEDYEPPASLLEWLAESDEAPIFVGFGSMVIPRPQDLADLIAAAAVESKTRVVLQSSWSSLEVSSDTNVATERGSRLVYQLGNCPHDWLFRHVRAVVHHGGSGTTMAGLRCGLPTMICPFFGDQHLWAQVLLKIGVAVDPVPIQRLTSDALVSAFKTLRGQTPEGLEMVARARELGAKMADEDGVQGAVRAFYAQLPSEALACDASLLLDGSCCELRPARWYSPYLGLKLSQEARQVLQEAWSPEEVERCGFREYRHCTYWRFAEPSSLARGIQQGVATAITRYAQAGGEIIAEPVRGGYRGYVDGGLMGVLRGSVAGIWRGLSRGGYYLLSGTRRLVTRPMQALQSANGASRRSRRFGSAHAQGDVPTTAEDAALIEHFELNMGSRDRLLSAVEDACVLRRLWATRVSASAAGARLPGDPIHEMLPLGMVLALLSGLADGSSSDVALGEGSRGSLAASGAMAAAARAAAATLEARAAEEMASADAEPFVSCVDGFPALGNLAEEEALDAALGSVILPDELPTTADAPAADADAAAMPPLAAGALAAEADDAIAAMASPAADADAAPVEAGESAARDADPCGSGGTSPTQRVETLGRRISNRVTSFMGKEECRLGDMTKALVKRVSSSVLVRSMSTNAGAAAEREPAEISVSFEELLFALHPRWAQGEASGSPASSTSADAADVKSATLAEAAAAPVDPG